MSETVMGRELKNSKRGDCGSHRGHNPASQRQAFFFTPLIARNVRLRLASGGKRYVDKSPNRLLARSHHSTRVLLEVLIGPNSRKH